ncbi:DUF2288 domain-containing protein [Oscillatoria sp. CS-180]|uniref:DUF2288 domain-containing protein n=1 Tax=Oscillatoria sp. CS-180 TaxID=3021720 RepID=UPI00232ABE2A|nr:DUF2288 domain-containing protein [Oscillatoria sp. CS-180]MDB9528828.1 DUF2288 domain-containing protein [Oscillatoria sp. CS-180]
MTQQLRQELEALVGPAAWHNLLPHAARDSLVVVNSDLDIVEVGVAVVTDNVNFVQRWISEALIAKPTVEQLEDWERDRGREFQALIVQPYVLIQDITVDNSA